MRELLLVTAGFAGGCLFVRYLTSGFRDYLFLSGAALVSAAIVALAIP